MKRMLHEAEEREAELKELKDSLRLYQIQQIWEMDVPSDVWQLIFSFVENDHASLWLELLSSSSIPYVWREAISQRSSLSFPQKTGYVYNHLKIIELMKKFPSLKKVAIYFSVNECTFPKFNTVVNLTLLPTKHRKRGRKLREEYYDLSSSFPNLQILSVRESLFNFKNISLIGRQNITQLSVLSIGQEELDLFPNLVKLQLFKVKERFLNIDNHLHLEEIHFEHTRNHSGTIYFSLRLKEKRSILMKSDKRKQFFNGLFSIDDGSISGSGELITTCLKVRLLQNDYQEESFVSDKNRISFKGQWKDGKIFGKFIVTTLSTGEMEVFDDIEKSEYYYRYRERLESLRIFGV